MSFMVVDVVTDEIVESNFEYKNHAELFIEVHGKIILMLSLSWSLHESSNIRIKGRLNARN